MSKKRTPLWREAHFQVKMYKTHVRATFGVSDVEKVHVVLARSTFRSQNVAKHHMFAPLLEVRMSKKCTPLWREAHFEVKMFEGSLEVKLPTIWTDEKQSREEAERRERLEERRSEEKESEERRCRWAKRCEESRETRCFSNDLWLRRVEK